MGRLEIVEYECDWCGTRAPPAEEESPVDSGYDRHPEDWQIIDGCGFCDEICARCAAAANLALAEIKLAKKEARAEAALVQGTDFRNKKEDTST